MRDKDSLNETMMEKQRKNEGEKRSCCPLNVSCQQPINASLLHTKLLCPLHSNGSPCVTLIALILRFILIDFISMLGSSLNHYISRHMQVLHWHHNDLIHLVMIILLHIGWINIYYKRAYETMQRMHHASGCISDVVAVLQSSVNNRAPTLNPPTLTVTEPPPCVYTLQVPSLLSVWVCVSVFCDRDPLHRPCYHRNASMLHQLNMGLLPLAWCETFRRGGVVQVGAYCGWLVSCQDKKHN